jgi:uncharacterized protein
MTKLFIDTWGWINLFNRTESYHQQVSHYYNEARSKQTLIITTDYILDEVYTLLFKRLPLDLARKAIETISDSVEIGYLNLEWISPERFEASAKMRLKFRDKPNISFTDLTSMVVMQELGISDIMTGDAHFTHVGLGFVLHPK